MLSNPGLGPVQLLESVLFLVLPFHMLLLIQHGVPPNIQKLFSPSAASNEEGTQVESRAILGEHEIHGIDIAIAYGASRVCIQIFIREGVGDVERVEDVDIAVHVAIEVVEHMTLKRV